MRAGADVSAKDARLNAPLHLAAARGNRPICEILLRAGADARATDKEGKMPFEIAQARSFQNIIFLLQDAASR